MVGWILIQLARPQASNIWSGSLLVRTSRIFSARNSCSRASDERCSQGRTVLFAQPRQATNVQKLGPNYATLVRHRTSMWPARACGRSKNLGKFQKLVRPWPEQPNRLRRPCISSHKNAFSISFGQIYNYSRTYNTAPKYRISMSFLSLEPW